MSEPLITLDRIAVRRRDRWLLKASSWRINAGEQWVVTGVNGAGKTTLVKAVAGLLPVVQGRIQYHFIEGCVPADAIAYVACDARRELWRREKELDHRRAFAGRFDGVTTVRQLLTQPLVRSLPSSRTPFPFIEIVATFELQALLERPAMTLSFGEMSRVLIARELIRRPKMLILDEPFEGLDAFNRQDLVAIVNRLAVAGLPIILATHRAEEVLPATTHRLTIEGERISSIQRVKPSTGASGNHVAVGTPQFRGFTSKMAPSRDATRRHALSEPLIDMQAVTVKYGDLIVLDRLNWQVRAGEHWAISGPNGAGKSTLLKLITGDCLQVYANRIRLFGRRRGTDQSLWEIRQKLGVVSPDVATAYQNQLSALDVVCSGFFGSVGLYRHCRAGQIESARAWLRNFDIDELSGIRFNRLSQGQRQLPAEIGHEFVSRVEVRRAPAVGEIELILGIVAGRRDRSLVGVVVLGV